MPASLEKQMLGGDGVMRLIAAGTTLPVASGYLFDYLVVNTANTQVSGLIDSTPIPTENYILNPLAVGGTGTTAPTDWSFSTVSGVTVSFGATGQATVDGVSVNYVDITVSGTATSSSAFLNIRPLQNPSHISGVLYAPGNDMIYTTSAYFALVSGTLPSGTSAPNYQLSENSAAGSFVSGSQVSLTAMTSGLTKFSHTRILSFPSTATNVQTRFGHAFVSGTSYNYVLRFGLPVLERTAVNLAVSGQYNLSGNNLSTGIIIIGKNGARITSVSVVSGSVIGYQSRDKGNLRL